MYVHLLHTYTLEAGIDNVTKLGLQGSPSHEEAVHIRLSSQVTAVLGIHGPYTHRHTHSQTYNGELKLLD